MAKRPKAALLAGGMKHDHGKDRWDLVPWGVLQEVVKVLTYGASKYSAENWKKVEPYRERYFAAAMRHLTAWRNGELVNAETGLSHLAHAITNLIFLSWKDNHKGE